MAAQAWLDKNYDKKFVLKCTTEVKSTDDDSGDAQPAVKRDTKNLQIKTDVEWCLETAEEAEGPGPDPSRCVALMEYKRKHLINPKELTAARFYQGDDIDTFKKHAKTVDETRTYFERTANYFMKQVGRYQEQREVDDVCLFDWDTMFILNFDSLKGNDNLGEDGSPQDETNLWPAGMFYQERAETSAKEAECTFRSLLLAFLIRALKRNSLLSNPNKPLAPIKYDESRMLSPLIISACWYFLWCN